MIDYTRVGERIRDKRKKRKMTQSELAEAVGLSTEYVCEIENFKKKAGLTAFIDIAEVLGFSMDELFYGIHCEDKEMHIIALILEDCSDYERQVICNNVKELKKILRENKQRGMS